MTLSLCEVCQLACHSQWKSHARRNQRSSLEPCSGSSWSPVPCACIIHQHGGDYTSNINHPWQWGAQSQLMHFTVNNHFITAVSVSLRTNILKTLTRSDFPTPLINEYSKFRGIFRQHYRLLIFNRYVWRVSQIRNTTHTHAQICSL